MPVSTFSKGKLRTSPETVELPAKSDVTNSQDAIAPSVLKPCGIGWEVFPPCMIPFCPHNLPLRRLLLVLFNQGGPISSRSNGPVGAEVELKLGSSNTPSGKLNAAPQLPWDPGRSEGQGLESAFLVSGDTVEWGTLRLSPMYYF